MASGMQMMMKAMGLDPEALIREATEQFHVIATAVQAGEAKIAALEAGNQALHIKLDLVMSKLGVVSPPSHRVALTTPALGYAPTLVVNQA